VSNNLKFQQLTKEKQIITIAAGSVTNRRTYLCTNKAHTYIQFTLHEISSDAIHQGW